MKKISILLAMALLLFSCWKTTEEPESTLDQSTQIVSDYADTLEWSIWDARSSVEAINERTNTIWK